MGSDGLKLRVRISTRAAIVAGKTTTGVVTMSVTDEDLRRLDVAMREELALAFEADEVIESNDPPIVEATMEALHPVLAARVAIRKRADEERRVLDARSAEQKLVHDRAVAAKNNARSKALRTWIERHGDDDQKARMAEGFLPENEILDAVADELLTVPGYEEYRHIYKGEACDCACAAAVQFTQRTPPQHMDAFQFARLQSLREAAPTGSTVEPYEHRAHCPRCKCVPLARLSAKVSFPWEGWLIVRRFAL